MDVNNRLKTTIKFELMTIMMFHHLENSIDIRWIRYSTNFMSIISDNKYIEFEKTVHGFFLKSLNDHVRRQNVNIRPLSALRIDNMSRGPYPGTTLELFIQQITGNQS